MEQFVGLDVSQKLTHICVVDREGKALWRGSSPTTPEDIAAAVRAHAPGAVRIGFETGALSTWLWHGLKKIGLPIVCLDARHAKAVLIADMKSRRGHYEALGMPVDSTVDYTAVDEYYAELDRA